MRSVARLTSALAALATVFAVVVPAESAPDRKACIQAADDGQKYRDEGKLSTAREMFIACSSKGCPAVISKQCAEWLKDVEKDTPTVTYRAKDERGKEILDVKVSVDGLKVLDAIDAKAMTMDAGEHTVRFDRADGKFVEEKVVIRVGEKNRIVELAFPAPSAKTAASEDPKSEDPSRPPSADRRDGFEIPLLAWVGVGVAAAGGVTMAAFAISANSDETELRESGCAPRCPPSERDGIETKILLANVGMGVGIAGLAVAVVSTILANSGSKATVKSGSASGAKLLVGPSGLKVHF